MIPEAAVDAAADAVHDEFCRDQYHAGHIGPACYDYKVEARTILEAAATHMTDRAADTRLLAIAWAEAYDAGFQEGAGFGSTPNPYVAQR